MWQGDVAPSDLPLIRHWTTDKFKSRLEGEIKAGKFGFGKWVEGVYPISKKSDCLLQMEADDEDKGSDSEHEGEEDDQWIKFKLPPNEKSRMDIKKVATDAFHEAFLLFQRDLSVVSHFHIDKLRKMKKSADSLKRQKVSASKPSSSSHPYDVVDSVVDDGYEDFLKYFNYLDFYNAINKLVEEILSMKDCPKQKTDQEKKVEKDRKEEGKDRVGEEEKQVEKDRKEEWEEKNVENDDDKSDDEEDEEEEEERKPTIIVQSVPDSEEQTVSIDALIAGIDEAGETKKYNQIVNVKGLLR